MIDLERYGRKTHRFEGRMCLGCAQQVRHYWWRVVACGGLINYQLLAVRHRVPGGRALCFMGASR